MTNQTVLPESKPSWAPVFFTVWTAQALSLAGSRIAQFALVWWLTQTTGSATVLAMATLVTILPRVLLGPVAGALTDRWDRRRVMMFADAFVALASAWLAYLFWRDRMQVGHVYLIMFLQTVGASFHGPAMISSTALMVPETQLTRVAGLNQTLNGIMGIVAPPLGALLMGLLPLSGIMLLDVITAAPAIGTLFFVHIPQPAWSEHKPAGRASLLADVRAGLSYVCQLKGLFVVFGISAIITLMIRPAFTLLPLLVTDHFGGASFTLAGFESALGLGIVAGGGILSIVGGFRRRTATIMAGIIGMGIGLCWVSVMPTSFVSLAMVALFVCGFMFPIIDGPTVALIQSVVRPDMQGRVFSLLISISDVFSPLSMVIAGPIAETFGLRLWYIVGGITCVLMGGVGLVIPVVRTLEQPST